ncbi:MAG: sigma-54-dependent Fis family transcriptional regulator [Candidatus Omnitrophota bacterium]|jgi:two-component system response regulator HydG|nr:MAG: sigma-54-dependent Fis family transcriptional regulator [Candidatus Omnitrophota bacterium]
MRGKNLEQITLKGVYVAILASKGPSAKSLSDLLDKTGCKVLLASELDKLLDMAVKNPVSVLLIESGCCEELEEKKSSNLPGIADLGSETIVIASPSKMDEGMLWASKLNGQLLNTPVSSEQLTVALERALEIKLLKSRLVRLESFEPTAECFGSILVKSPEMKDVLRIARILSTREDCVFMVGGIGTGKELLAQTIHNTSSRRHGPFYSINCRSFSNEDLATELFGKGEEGAPDASEGRNLLDLCNGGSLYLDEIGAISPNIQGKLQRFLEDRSYTRVNSRTVCHADVRVFAASSTPLTETVGKGEFSEDLFFRLNRFTLQLPPLRKRSEDIPMLAKSFLMTMARQRNEDYLKLTEEALKLMLEYHWPGNVRELENVLEYAALVAGKGPIDTRHLPKQFHDEVGSIYLGTSVDDLPPMTEIERRYILRVMEATHGNKFKAASILDINRATLHRKLQIYERSKIVELD